MNIITLLAEFLTPKTNKGRKSFMGSIQRASHSQSSVSNMLPIQPAICSHTGLGFTIWVVLLLPLGQDAYSRRG